MRRFIDFFRSVWFTRVWVLQEVVLAPSAVCYCGNLSVSWRDVHRAGAWAFFATPTSGQLSFLWNAATIRGLEMAQMVNQIDRLLGLFISAPRVIYLPGLILCSAYLNVTDPRDYLYGLLGLAKWEPDKEEYMQWFRVDYSLSASAVARDTARAWIIQDGSVEALRDADGQYFSYQSALGCRSPS
jgi:hypothetical protein